MTTVIVITAKRNGFRRCGVAHSDQPTRWRHDEFTGEQWEELMKEPQLFIAVEDRDLGLGLEQHNAFTSSAALPEAPSTAQNAQSQTLEAIASALGNGVVLPVAPVEGNVPPRPTAPVIEQDKVQLAADIELDALWEEACQEDQVREAAKALAAKPPVNHGKAKTAKAEGAVK